MDFRGAREHQTGGLGNACLLRVCEPGAPPSQD